MPNPLKHKSIILVTLGVLLVISNVYNPNVTSQTLSVSFDYAEPYRIDNFDPLLQTWTPRDRWMNAIFSGLYQRSINNREFIPVLAADYPTVTKVNESDGTVMIVSVTLKQGLKFSNGYDLNATDVAYSFQMNLMKSLSSSLYFIWTNDYQFTNDSVRVISEYAIDFRFKVFRSDYLEILSFRIFCEELFRPAIESGIYSFNDPTGYYLVGTGPFKLERIAKTNSSDFIFLVPNDYWSLTGLPNPQIDELTFISYPKEVALMGLLNGTVDAVDYSYRFNFTDIQGATDVIGIKHLSHNTQAIWPNQIHPVWGHTAQLDAYLGQNFTYSQTNQSFIVRSFWSEISNGNMSELDRIEAARLVRQAMSYAFSREYISSTITLNTTFPASNLLPPFSEGWNASIPTIQKNLNHSMQLIQQAFALAGWNNITIDPTETGIYVGDLASYFPEFWNVTALTPGTKQFRDQWTLYITSELEEIGFNFTQVNIGNWSYVISSSLGYPITNAEYNLSNGLHTPVPLHPLGGYDILFIGFVTPIRWDLSTIFTFENFKPTGANFINYWDPDLEYQLIMMKEETDPSAWQVIMNDIQMQLFTKNPAIPILYPSEFFAIRDTWMGIDPILLMYNKQPWWEVQLIPQPTTTETSTITTTSTTSSSTQPILTNSSTTTFPITNTTTEPISPPQENTTSPTAPLFLSLPEHSIALGLLTVLGLLTRRGRILRKRSH